MKLPWSLLAAGLAFPLLASPAQSGLNAGAVAHLYWQVGTGAGSSSTTSNSGLAQAVVTVTGLNSFRGGEVQLVAFGNNGVALPDAWKGNGTGGCNDGNFDYRLGGYGGAYPSAFIGVPGLATAQNTEYFDIAQYSCQTPDSTALFWMEAAGSTGIVKNPAVEYGLWAIRLDLRGTANGGATDCPGDQGDVAGPTPVSISAAYRAPCNTFPQGAYVALLDANDSIDFIPFATGASALGWEGPPQIRDVTPPVVSVLFPNGGENLIEGSATTIQIQASDNVAVASMDIDLSTNGGASYSLPLAHGVPYTAAFPWTPANILGSNCRVRVTAYDAAGNHSSDASDASFQIVPTVNISLVTPNGGATYQAGYSFTEVSSVAPGGSPPTRMYLYFSTDGGLSYPYSVFGPPGYIQYRSSVDVTTPGVLSNHARMRIVVQDVNGTTASDESDGDFRIATNPDAYAEVKSPNGGEVIATGAPVTVQCYATSAGALTTMDLALSLDGGVTFPVPVATNVSYKSSFMWIVPPSPTMHARVRLTVRDDRGFVATDVSDADFEIQGAAAPPPTVTLDAPNGGEFLGAGSTASAISSASGPVSITSLDLALSTDGGATYPIALLHNVAYSSPTSWTVPGVATTHARIRITVRDEYCDSASDASDSDFTIQETPPPPPTVTLTSPNGHETLTVGTTDGAVSTASAAAGITSMDLALSTNSGVTYPTAVATGVAYASPIAWTVPIAPTTHARLRITIHAANGDSASDASDSDFTIQETPPPPPTVTLTSPNGHETLTVGTTDGAVSTASAAAGITSMDLALSTNSGVTYPTAVATGVAYASPIAWTVPIAPTTHARLRITIHAANGDSASDASDSDFTIQAAPPALPNAAAIAGLYWENGTAPGTPNFQSFDGMPRLVVTVKGMKSFRGAEVQLLVTGQDNLLSDAWKGTGTGGCNEGNFDFRPGGYGGNYPSAFAGVPGVGVSNNSEYFNAGDCLTPGGRALLWFRATGTGGAACDSTQEYAVWAATFDLRGTANGGSVDCAGDLSHGAIPAQIRALLHPPCPPNALGAFVALVDADSNVTYAPISLGNSTLIWQNFTGTATAVAISGLAGSAGELGVTLQWTLSDPRAVRSLRVERRAGGAAPYSAAQVLASGLAPQSSMKFLDTQASPSTRYAYRVVAILQDGSESPASFEIALPAAIFALRRPSPNPFNGESTLRYSLSVAGMVRLDVVDASGRLLRVLESGSRGAGTHEVAWDGRDGAGRVVVNGVYFARLSAGGQTRIQRLVRVR